MCLMLIMLSERMTLRYCDRVFRLLAGKTFSPPCFEVERCLSYYLSTVATSRLRTVSYRTVPYATPTVTTLSQATRDLLHGKLIGTGGLSRAITAQTHASGTVDGKSACITSLHNQPA